MNSELPGGRPEPENTVRVGGDNVGARPAPGLPKIQGSSITLYGSGDRSGKDIDNSMSLGDFYGRFVVGGEE